MSAATPVRHVNGLLESLPRAERDRILKRHAPVDLVVGATLCKPDEPFRHAYFPLSGFISVVATAASHQRLQTRLIGSEGMLGATMVLGIHSSPLRGIVQGAGEAVRMTASELRRELAYSPALRRTLNRYLYTVMTELSRTVACTCFHEIEPRLARSLLMTHDRANADHFHLTHQVLADRLGVQRSAVTIAAGSLQRRKLIRYSRGKITILSRNRLEEVSCGCHDAVNHGRARPSGREDRHEPGDSA